MYFWIVGIHILLYIVKKDNPPPRPIHPHPRLYGNIILIVQRFNRSALWEKYGKCSALPALRRFGKIYIGTSPHTTQTWTTVDCRRMCYAHHTTLQRRWLSVCPTHDTRWNNRLLSVLLACLTHDTRRGSPLNNQCSSMPQTWQKN